MKRRAWVVWQKGTLVHDRPPLNKAVAFKRSHNSPIQTGIAIQCIGKRALVREVIENEDGSHVWGRSFLLPFKRISDGTKKGVKHV